MSLESKIISKLVDVKEIQAVWDKGLRPEVFEDPVGRYAYEFIIKYWQDSQMKVAPTPFVLETEIPGIKLEDDPEAEAWWLADKLIERYAKNGVNEMLLQTAQMVTEDPKRALKALQAAVYDANQVVSPRNIRSDMSDYEARRQRYQERLLKREAGIPLGLEEIDEHTGGMRPGELWTVGAYSAVGKTMFLLYVASAARKAGYQPIIYSLEMPKEEIEERIDAMLSGVSYDRLSRSRLTDEEMGLLHPIQEAFGDGRILIEVPDEGDRTVAHLCARARHSGSDLMLIDQLSFMEETRQYVNEKYRQGSILKQLKNEIGNSTRGKLPCLLAAQFKRESLDRDDGPRIDDFADAAEVERTSDFCLGLSRNQQQLANRLMRIDILKGRRCRSARWMLHWDLIDHSHISVMDRITR
jgi:hypothetical protein